MHRVHLLAGFIGLGACTVEDDPIACDGPPCAAPGHGRTLPLFAIAPPIHAEDLPKNHYLQIQRDTQGEKWHDITVVRFDDDDQAWTGQQHGTPGEQGRLGWNLPIYSGVAGEVISCWRNAPYDMSYQPTLEQIGGNFMIIRTDDDHYVFYAHMQTDAIPAELCPNHSASGWYEDVTNKHPGSNIPAESYVEEGERARVSVGQFIGRMGAHGNAAGTHVHVHAGDVSRDAAGVLTVGPVTYELDFTDVWYRVADDLPPGAHPWLPAAPGAIPTLAHDHALHVWPSVKHEATHAGPPRLGQFNQPHGGLQDALCHHVGSGGLWLDYGDVDHLNGTDWNGGAADFCSSPDQRLHRGDFDGDGHQDLLCHDGVDGRRWVRYATTHGDFTGVTTFASAAAWCDRQREALHVGDFNGDGRDDLLCHDKLTGERRIDLSTPIDWVTLARKLPFGATDLTISRPWCNDYDQRLHLGDFDGDGRDDLLCHHILDGKLWLDESRGAALFDGTDFALPDARWCDQGGQRMLVGDFTGDGRDDLLCHDGDDGDLELRAAQPGAARFLAAATWTRADSGWCTGLHARLRVGDLGGDARDDLLCHDQKSGARMADFTAPIAGPTAGGLQGVDWSRDRGWCDSTLQGLH